MSRTEASPSWALCHFSCGCNQGSKMETSCVLLIKHPQACEERTTLGVGWGVDTSPNRVCCQIWACSRFTWEACENRWDAGLPNQSFWFSGLGWSPRIYCNQFLGDADAAGPGTTLWEPLAPYEVGKCAVQQGQVTEDWLREEACSWEGVWMGFVLWQEGRSEESRCPTYFPRLALWCLLIIFLAQPNSLYFKEMSGSHNSNNMCPE